MKERAEHRGSTRIELRMAVAILGELVALLRPVVHAACGAARWARCVNDLEQLGLAQHSRATLPPAGTRPGSIPY